MSPVVSTGCPWPGMRIPVGRGEYFQRWWVCLRGGVGPPPEKGPARRMDGCLPPIDTDGHQNAYGWQAGGTHSTGMLSCSGYRSKVVLLVITKPHSSPELVKQLSFGHFFLYPASLDTVLLPHVEQNLYRSFQSNRHLPCPTMAVSSGTVKYGGMRN